MAGPFVPQLIVPAPYITQLEDRSWAPGFGPHCCPPCRACHGLYPLELTVEFKTLPDPVWFALHGIGIPASNLEKRWTLPILGGLDCSRIMPNVNAGGEGVAYGDTFPVDDVNDNEVDIGIVCDVFWTKQPGIRSRSLWVGFTFMGVSREGHMDLSSPIFYLDENDPVRAWDCMGFSDEELRLPGVEDAICTVSA